MQHYPPLFLSGQEHIFIHTHVFCTDDVETARDCEIDNPQEFGFVNKTFNILCDFLIKKARLTPVTDHYQKFPMDIMGAAAEQDVMCDLLPAAAEVVRKYARVALGGIEELQKMFLRYDAMTSVVCLTVYIEDSRFTIAFMLPVQLEIMIHDYVESAFYEHMDHGKFPELSNKSLDMVSFVKNFITSSTLAIVPEQKIANQQQ